MSKPTLSAAKRLFKRRNPGVIGLKASWDRRPVSVDGAWYGSVEFTAPGYAPRRMRICTDAEGTAIY